MKTTKGENGTINSGHNRPLRSLLQFTSTTASTFKSPQGNYKFLTLSLFLGLSLSFRIPDEYAIPVE